MSSSDRSKAMTASIEVQRGYELELSPRRIRTFFGGVVAADSERMRLLRPPWGPPAYYFPREDVKLELLVPSNHSIEPGPLGPATFWNLVAGKSRSEHAARAYLQPPENIAGLAECIAFDWNSMDAWFEEDEEIFIHPRDPRHRVDVRESSRHIRVEIEGQTVADTRRPRILFETGHPVRYYIPRLDVRLDALLKSDTSTGCPYKGTASYFSVQAPRGVQKDVAWSYVFTYEDCPKIANCICFYNERVDIYIDDALQDRPESRPPRRPGSI
jgi:uncharacterized protein (DUF427 family)